MVRVGAPLAVALCAVAVVPASAAATATLGWSVPVSIDAHAETSGLTGVSCPSATECVAIDPNGQEVTFNPQAPQAAAAAVSLSNHPLLAVACIPGAQQCSAVDTYGQEVTFNPQSPGGATPRPVDPHGIPLSLACPSTTLCTTVDSAGYEASFNPASAVPKPPALVDSGQVLVGVDCPSTSECDAVDTAGSAVTYDPQNGQKSASRSIDGNSPVAISCPPGICVVVDSGGGAAYFGAQGQGTTTIDGNGSSAVSLSDLSCVSSTQCVAMDAKGTEVDFNPSALHVVTRGSVDPGHPLTGLSCPAADQCTAVDSAGRAVTFSPQAPGTPTPVVIDGHTNLSAVTCPTSTKCVAVDLGGGEVMFSPGSSPGPVTGTIDSTTTAVYGVSCPSAVQCTAVDSGGQEVTFDPASPGSRVVTAIDTGHALLSVACPSVTQCTAVDDRGAELSFDPQAAGKPQPAMIDSGHGLSVVACPSTVQCTAVDDSGDEVTFNPQSPGAPAVIAIDASPAVDLACPSSSQCTAIDAAGQQVTFFPQLRSELVPKPIDGGEELNAVACRTATDCLAVDAGGRVLEGDPRGTGSWSIRQIDSGSLLDVACSSALECVTIDSPGDALTGSSGPLPPVPGAVRRPSLAGIVQQARTLVVSDGDWSNSPTSYVYEWQRCTANGRRCAAITTAGAPIYALRRSDVGHRIRVVEWAYNISGTGSPQATLLTRVVLPAPFVRRAALFRVGKRHPSLLLRISAVGGAASLRSIQVWLPPGLSFTRRGRAARPDIAVLIGHRTMKFSLRISGRRLVIGLRRSASIVTVRVIAPLLGASPGLARRVRRHRSPTVRLVVVVRQLRGVVMRLTQAVRPGR